MKYNLDYIIEKVFEYYLIKNEELAKKIRKKNIVYARKTVILLSKRYSTLSNKELTEILNLSQPTFSNILSDESNEEMIKIIKT